MQSSAKTVEEYLASLPPDRREQIAGMRDLVRRNLPPGYQEQMDFGMIAWGIPLDVYPGTYNGKPLCFAGLASHKNHCALYLMSAYQDGPSLQRLRDGFRAEGKKLDIGKSCIRFRTIEDLAVGTIASVIAATPPDAFIRLYETSAPRRKPPARTGARKTAASRKRSSREVARKGTRKTARGGTRK